MSSIATIQFSCPTLQHTRTLAAAVARHLKPGDILLLEGPLGSGKTYLARGVAAALGADESGVSSPTFIICQEYELRRDDPLTNQGFTTIAHIDAYRLTGPEELEAVGFEDLLSDMRVLVMIEWPSRIADAVPAERALHIEFEHVSEDARVLTIKASRDRLEQIAAAQLSTA